MVNKRRPTRAEATDVANAILDGTDCVMLSEESAIGKYPVEAVAMLAKIAAAIETQRPAPNFRERLKMVGLSSPVNLSELIALSVESTLEWSPPAAVFVPTRSGATARSIARFRPPVWIIAVSSQEATCQRLQFTFGVHSVHQPDHPENWTDYVRRCLEAFEITGDYVVLTEGPSSKHPEANNRMELIALRQMKNQG
jgi:pyruvate kinase